MSYVDLMGSVRWTDHDHTNRSEAFVRAVVPHAREHIMVRRMLSMILLAILPPDNPLRSLCVVPTPEQLGEVVAAAMAYAQAEVESNAGRADSVLLNAALDIEEADLEARDALTTAAPQAVLDLLAARAAARAPAPTEGVPA